MRIQFIDTEKENKINLGRDYDVPKLGINECALSSEIEDKYPDIFDNIKVGDKLSISFLALYSEEAIYIEYNDYAEINNLPRLPYSPLNPDTGKL